MSIEPDIMTCSRCGFRTGSSRLWGIFQYIMADDIYLDVPRTAGWCYSCNNISPIENFPDRLKTEEEIGSLKKELSQISTFKLKFFKSARKKAEYFNEMIKEKELLLKLMKHHTSPPRCLECGSTEVKIVVFPSVDEGTTAELNFRHPNCGGKFVVSKSEILFSMLFKPRIYNINGELI